MCNKFIFWTCKLVSMVSMSISRSQISQQSQCLQYSFTAPQCSLHSKWARYRQYPRHLLSPQLAFTFECFISYVCSLTHLWLAQLPELYFLVRVDFEPRKFQTKSETYSWVTYTFMYQDEPFRGHMKFSLKCAMYEAECTDAVQNRIRRHLCVSVLCSQ